MGGEKFGQSLGFPGTISAKNITPAGTGKMTDGELYRTLTSGIGQNGKAIFPLMSYKAISNLSEEDIYSIIAYLRTLKPVANAGPEKSLDFPVNYLVKTLPSPHRPAAEPDRANPYEYGKYLVTSATCMDCHTMQEKGAFVKGMEYAGGLEIRFPNGTVRSANITPDEETGIGLWTKEQFIGRFKHYDSPGAKSIPADSVAYATFMPWTLLAGMSEEDLGAIYSYLRTVPPVKHKVEKFTPAASHMLAGN
jgi:hypothetical protein